MQCPTCGHDLDAHDSVGCSVRACLCAGQREEPVTVDVFESEPLLFMAKCDMAQRVLDSLQAGHAVLINPVGVEFVDASITWNIHQSSPIGERTQPGSERPVTSGLPSAGD